jgi:hypothetical protein
MQYSSPQAIWNLLFGVKQPSFKQNEGTDVFHIIILVFSCSAFFFVFFSCHYFSLSFVHSWFCLNYELVNIEWCSLDLNYLLLYSKKGKLTTVYWL